MPGLSRFHIFFLLLLLMSGTISIAEASERDSLREDMFSIGGLGIFYDYRIDRDLFTSPPKDPEGHAWGQGVQARWDKALGDAGSGIAGGLTYYQMDGARDDDRKLIPKKKSDQAYRLHLGYFTRIHPFKWMPRIQGGISKLRFEFAYGSDLNEPLFPHFTLGASRGIVNSHLFASYQYARPIQGRSWIDAGIGVGLLNEGSYRGGTIFELSLALSFRSGDKGGFP